MIMSQKPRQVRNNITGEVEWMPYPPTRVEAIRENIVKYAPFEPCPIHGHRTVYWTLTGIAACCAHPAGCEHWNAAIANGEPTSLLEASDMGKDYYWRSPEVNRLCGHPRKLTLAGKCWFCEQAKQESPRQVALRRGETWYTPLDTDPCKKGHLAPRRVSSGACKQCEYDERNRKNAAVSRTVEFVEQFPGQVIDPATARSCGFKMYFTGKPCHRGHVAPRYVSTMGCVECKNSGRD